MAATSEADDPQPVGLDHPTVVPRESSTEERDDGER
jgi:hypothetical protein